MMTLSAAHSIRIEKARKTLVELGKLIQVLQMRERTFKARVLVFTSALLYSLSQSIECLWFLSFISLAPLLYALTRERSGIRLASLGLQWGVLMATGTAYWIVHALLSHYEKSPFFTLLFFLFLVALPVGILSGLFFTIFGLFERRKTLFLCCIFPSLWVISEYIREIVPVFIPWGLAGYAAAGDIRLAQAASSIGVYGLSFLVALVNGLIFKTIIQFHHSSLCMRRGSAPLCSIIACGPFATMSVTMIIMASLMAYGDMALREWSPANNASPGEELVGVAIVQGGHDVRERWNDRSFGIRLLEYISLTGKAPYKWNGRKIVIWPETILNSHGAFSAASLGLISSSIPDNSNLLSGGVRKDTYSRVYNSVVLIKGGKIAGWYDKHILLPFAEYTPLGAAFLGKFHDAPDIFTRGSGPRLLGVAGIPLGVSICFESAYPSHIAKSVQSGARILVNVSNDSWFGRTSQPFQHHRIARVRAIESRRYMARASNSGISSVIAPSGEVLAKIGLGEKGAVYSSIRPMDGISPYHRYGNVMVMISLAVSIISMFLMAFPALRKRLDMPLQ